MLAKCLNSTRTLASTIFGIFEPKGRWGGVKNFTFLPPLVAPKGVWPLKGETHIGTALIDLVKTACR